MRSAHIPAASALFLENFRQLRLAVPALPADLEDRDRVKELLAGLLDRAPGIVALQDDRLIGYLGGYLVDHFRDTERKAAWCPE